MVTPIKVLIFNDLHKYFNTYFADYQQVNHKLNELLILLENTFNEVLGVYVCWINFRHSSRFEPISVVDPSLETL